MMNSDCEKIKDQIADFVTGILSEAQELNLQQHLIECSACRDYARALKNEDMLLTKFVETIDINMTHHQERLLQTIECSCQSKQTETFSLRRLIMKNPITKFSVAAVIIFGVIVAINPFGGSIDGASVAFADVQSAFLDQSWVHVQYDNSTESWYNLKTGDHCHIQLNSSGKRFLYIHRQENLRQEYEPFHAQHIREDRPARYKDNVIPPYEPRTAWETIVGHWERLAEKDDAENYKVEIKTDTLDGNSAVRFDVYYIDILGRKLLNQQIWADPETKLPIKIQKILSAQEQKDQNREYITGVFSYPETGPASIYDLGVPKDLPIARSNDEKIADPFIKEIFETAKQFYEDFPKRCRAVIWQNDRESEIEIIWRNDEKIRLNHYFNMDGQRHPEYHLDLPTTVDDILIWAETQPPISIYMDDEEKSYHRSHHPAFEDLKTPTTRITESWAGGLPNIAHFIEEHWEYYIHRTPAQYELIDDAPESLSQYIGIKIESGVVRRDHYIDPEHDYIRVQNIWWKKRDDQWKKEREYIVTEMTQLPTGQWYVTKRKLITYPNPERGTVGYEHTYNIDITLHKKDEFPPDTFNGEKLLEGAEIETY